MRSILFGNIENENISITTNTIQDRTDLNLIFLFLDGTSIKKYEVIDSDNIIITTNNFLINSPSINALLRANANIG